MYQTINPKTTTTGVLSEIPNGKRGTKIVLLKMRDLIREGRSSLPVRLLAADIVKGLPPKKWVAEASAIQTWVRDNIRYTRDINTVETLHTAEKILELGYGDCDDKTILVASMLESIGHPTRIKAVGFSGGMLSHVYPEVRIGGAWVPVETTEDGWNLGKAPPGIKNTMIVGV